MCRTNFYLTSADGQRFIEYSPIKLNFIIQILNNARIRTFKVKSILIEFSLIRLIEVFLTVHFCATEFKLEAFQLTLSNEVLFLY